MGGKYYDLVNKNNNLILHKLFRPADFWIRMISLDSSLSLSGCSCLHVTPSSASSSLPPTTSMSSSATSINLLFGLLQPSCLAASTSASFYWYVHCPSSEHVKPSQSGLLSSNIWPALSLRFLIASIQDVTAVLLSLFFFSKKNKMGVGDVQ